MNQRKGFTLIELLVYIVIAAIIVGIAGQVFYDATKSRLRTTRLLESSVGTSDVIAYLQQDLQRVGLKTIMVGASSSSMGIQVVSNVYWNLASTPPDSSSFHAGVSGSGTSRQDTIIFRSATYDLTNQTINGWEEIKYHVDANKNLLRTVVSRKDLVGANVTPLPSPVVMAEGVVAFQLNYGIQTNDSAILISRSINQPCAITFPVSCCLAQTTATAATIAASGGNPLVGGLPPATEVLYSVMMGGNPTTMEQFVVEAGVTYKVEFAFGSNSIGSENFRSDQDLIALRIIPTGSATSNYPGTTDVLLYASMDQNIRSRFFEFTPSAPGNASVVWRFLMRPPLVSGVSDMTGASFIANKIEIRAMSASGYEWKSSFTNSAVDLRLKRRVRAIEMRIAVEKGTSVSTETKVIPILNNGL